MNILMALCKYSHFSSADDSNRQIARCILKNPKRMRGATIQEVADFCFTSFATISRFVRNIGCDSFAQFKEAYIREADEYSYFPISPLPAFTSLSATMEDYIDQSVNLIRRIQSELDRKAIIELADYIYNSKKVFIFSFFFASSFPYFQVDLSFTGKNYTICEIEAEQKREISKIDQNSFLLAVKNQEGRCHYMDSLIRQAKQQGAKVGLILNSTNATIRDIADCDLSFDGTGTTVDSAVFNDCITLLSLAYKKRYLSLT